MDRKKEPQPAIYVEEEHSYLVDLGVVPVINWQEARGSLRVEIPYDRALLAEDAPATSEYEVGRLYVRAGEAGAWETLPVQIGAGPGWQEFVRGNKKHVTSTSLAVAEPGDPLISMEGVVLDDLNEDGAAGVTDGIFSDIDAYSNPLVLQLFLWVPDLLSETRPSELHELETMLLRGENSRQIFIGNISAQGIESALAEGLSALANTAGGSILLGVERNGRVSGLSMDPESRRLVKGLLLRAALKSRPPAPIARLTEIEHAERRVVLRVETAATGATHWLGNTVFRRQGSSNVAETTQEAAVRQSGAATVAPERSLQAVFDRGEAGDIVPSSGEDAVVLNGRDGLRKLQLGAYLCGLINAGKRAGRIVITDLPRGRTGRFPDWLKGEEELEDVLEKELEQILPQLDPPAVERSHLGDQQIAIIHLPPWQLPVTLYQGKGFIWQNRSLNEAPVEELFDRFVDLAGSQGQAYSDQDVFLEEALLYRPIRPPERLESGVTIEGEAGLVYDPEYQAQVWRPRAFRRDRDTVGFSLRLLAPLHHVSLALEPDGSVYARRPLAGGRIRIRLNDVLVSGFEIRPEANPGSQWLQSIPVIKRTYLNIEYRARLNELFERRTKTSRMRFLIPHVLLDWERVEDMVQICADEGFRIYDKVVYDIAPTVPGKAVIRGIRSFAYYDIALLIGVICHRSELNRELHYDGWRDSKATHTAMLDVRVKMWGVGDNAEKEIGRLQMRLYQTMHQRLQHLRAE